MVTVDEQDVRLDREGVVCAGHGGVRLVRSRGDVRLSEVHDDIAGPAVRGDVQGVRGHE